MRRVLILGGTTEASQLATALADHPDLDVVTSFAGATAAPRAAAGGTRVGGFGGAEGLARHLVDERVDVLVDATHPFAAQMRWNARAAADETGTPCLRLERPPWTAEPGDAWTVVPDLAAAATTLVDRSFARVFLTTGRKELAPFAACPDTWFLVRSIEPPDPQPLPHAHVVLDRGPFTVAGERALLTDHRIDALVTKNSGGTAAAAKLTAARELAVPVLVVARPPNPPGPLATTVAAAITFVTT